MDYRERFHNDKSRRHRNSINDQRIDKFNNKDKLKARSSKNKERSLKHKAEEEKLKGEVVFGYVRLQQAV